MKALPLVLGLFLAVTASAADRFGTAAPLTAPSSNHQQSVRAAYLASGPLFVWMDDALRAGRYGGAPLQPSEQHFVAPSADGNMALAAMGDQALLLFVDHGTVSAARLGADGTVLTRPFAVATAPVTAPVAVAANGDGWLAIWGDGTGIYEVTIGRSGERLTGPTVLIDGPNTVGTVAVASNGSDFLAVWSTFANQTYAVNGLGVTGGGVAMGETRARLSDQALVPSVAFGGSEYLITWGSSSGGGLRGRRVRTAQELTQPASVLVMTTVSDVPVWMAWDGRSYEIAAYRTVMFHQYPIHYIEVLRAGPTGIVSEAMTDSVTITGDFAIAAGGGRAFFAFADSTQQIVVAAATLSPLSVPRSRISR
jgi:hypothetical protein